MADIKETISEVEEVKTTVETPDESIVDPSKIAVNADVVEETPKEEVKETKKTTSTKAKAPKAPKAEEKEEVKEDAKEDPFDTDEFETKIMKATGIMHPTIDKLIAAIKEAENDEAKEAAKRHLIWHIPAGAGCKHHDDLVAEVNAL